MTPSGSQRAALPYVAGLLLVALGGGTAHAQDLPSVSGDTLPVIDVEARFEEFQRDFARDFGVEGGDDAAREVEAIAERLKERFEQRFEDGAVFQWYQRGVRIYDRLERMHRRLEASTRWAVHGFRVHANVESVADGRLNLHAERRIQGFKVGFGMRDATAGRLGLRVGGVLRGYHINIDVDNGAGGRVWLGLEKRLD